MNELKHFNRRFKHQRGGIFLLYQLKRGYFNAFITETGRLGINQDNMPKNITLSAEESAELFGIYADWESLSNVENVV